MIGIYGVKFYYNTINLNDQQASEGHKMQASNYQSVSISTKNIGKHLRNRRQQRYSDSGGIRRQFRGNTSILRVPQPLSREEPIKSTIQAIFPIYTSQAMIWDNHDRYQIRNNHQGPEDQDSKTKTQTKGLSHNIIRRDIRKLSLSENCFNGLLQHDQDIFGKGRIIRGVQSAKKRKNIPVNNTHINNKASIEQQDYVDIINRTGNISIDREQRNKSLSHFNSIPNEVQFEPIPSKIWKDKQSKQSQQNKQSSQQGIIKLLPQKPLINFNNHKKISASRALQLFSQVFRRQDVQRVRIKRGLIGTSVQFSTKQVVLQERIENRDRNKDNKVNKDDKIIRGMSIKRKKGYFKENSTIFDDCVFMKKRRCLQKEINSMSMGQNYDIVGWEVSENL